MKCKTCKRPLTTRVETVITPKEKYPNQYRTGQLHRQYCLNCEGEIE